MDALRKAIEIAGGQAALARRIGKKPAHVWMWLNRDKRVPAEMCRPIEQATQGAVTRHQLRPDLFDPPAQALAEEGAA